MLELLQMNSSVHRWIRLQKDRLFLPVAKLCHRLGITPSMATIIGGIIGLASIPVLWINYWWFVLGSLLSVIWDGIDGVLARYTKQTSHRGGQLDYGIDVLLCLLLYSAVTWWLGETYWVIGLNWFIGVLLLNWACGGLIQITSMRIILFCGLAIGQPRLGLLSVWMYAVVMTVVVLYHLLHRQKPPPSRPVPDGE